MPALRSRRSSPMETMVLPELPAVPAMVSLGNARSSLMVSPYSKHSFFASLRRQFDIRAPKIRVDASPGVNQDSNRLLASFFVARCLAMPCDHDLGQITSFKLSFSGALLHQSEHLIGQLVDAER